MFADIMNTTKLMNFGLAQAVCPMQDIFACSEELNKQIKIKQLNQSTKGCTKDNMSNLTLGIGVSNILFYC